MYYENVLKLSKLKTSSSVQKGHPLKLSCKNDLTQDVTKINASTHLPSTFNHLCIYSDTHQKPNVTKS